MSALDECGLKYEKHGWVDAEECNQQEEENKNGMANGEWGVLGRFTMEYHCKESLWKMQCN